MTTNCDITIFNIRFDKQKRRDVFLPTFISGVSYHESIGSSISGKGVWKQISNYRIRIPIDAEVQDGKTYLRSDDYNLLSDQDVSSHWTISNESIVMVGEYDGEFPISREDLDRYFSLGGITNFLVTNYADNTIRGTNDTKHWRIGGM